MAIISWHDAIDQLPARGNRLGGPDQDGSMPLKRRASTLAFLSTMAIIATSAPAIAQDNYPIRPVKLIAPQAPGGGVDLVARIIADRLRIALGQPFVLQGHRFVVEASIGITVYPQHGEDVTTLLRRADIAMYEEKSRGKEKLLVVSG